MTTIKRFALAIASLSVIAAGCTSAGVAATVNDSEIQESTVLSIRTGTEGETSVNAEQYRNDLSRLIFTESMITAAEVDFGLTGLDSPEAREAYLVQLPPDEQQYLESIAQDPTLTPAALDVVVTQLVVRTAVHTALASAEEVLVDVWQNDRSLLLEVCASHILVSTEQEAQAVLERLEAGEDFVAIANEVSLDTVSVGGALPCPIPSSVLAALTAPFAAVTKTAPVGVPTGPVETGFGWHVIVVDSRESPETLEELAADPVRWIPDETIEFYWNRWLNDSVATAEISVRSDIGMWYPPVDGIIPPPDSP